MKTQNKTTRNTVESLPPTQAQTRGKGMSFPAPDAFGKPERGGGNTARGGGFFNPDSAIAFGTPFANPSASAHCSLRSTNHKVRLGKVQCASARSLCEIRPKPIAQFGFMALSAVLLTFLLSQGTAFAEKAGTDGLKTFGSIGKQLSILTKEKETVLLHHKGKGALTHMWFGADFKGYGQTMIRVYVDGEPAPSIDMEFLLGHGIGFNDDHAPWTTSKMGKTGSPSGIYNTFRIPFGKEIKVTAQLGSESPEKPKFWWILRGTENLPVTLGGVRLPDGARLKLHKLENREFAPLEEFDMCNVGGKGALFLVTIAARGLLPSARKERWQDLSYMESCIRAYFNGEKEPLLLSSGLEDYFLGTYYFNRGRYYSDVAGLTHLDKKKAEFSAYRFHDEDPVFFQNGLRLTNRVGEKFGKQVFGDPPKTRYTTYVWLYQW